MYISTLDKSIWQIDVDKYDNGNIVAILELYKDLTGCIGATNYKHVTLVTKLMLEIFGLLPAYDQYFVKTFRSIYSYRCSFGSVNKNSLLCLSDFYYTNKQVIDKIADHSYTTSFNKGEKTKLRFTKARVIDIYGFMAGQNRRAGR